MFECEWIGEDPAGLDDSALGEVVMAAFEHADRVQGWLLAAVAEADRRQVWAPQGGVNATGWLATRAPLGAKEARRVLADAHHLAGAPLVAAAVADGRLSASQGAALARARLPRVAELFDRDEAVLVDAAEGLSVDHTRLLARAWLTQADADGPAPADDDSQTARFLVDSDGRGRLDADLAPDGALIFGSVLERIMGDLFRHEKASDGPLTTFSQRRADALVEMARRAASDPDQPARPLVVVACDLSDLFTRAGWERSSVEHLFHPRPDGAAADVAGMDPRDLRAAARFGPVDLAAWRANGRPMTDSGQPVHPRFFHQLLCDADLVRVVTDGPSQVLDVGRAQRTATGPQRTALLIRDRGCLFPGCDRPPGWCHAHHLTYWEDGGTTDLEDLGLLCNRHHRDKHRGRFNIARQPDGTLIFTWPDGRIIQPPGRLPDRE